LEICPDGTVYMFGGKPYNGVYSLTGLSYQVSS
jgi:hypothetical protein